MQIACYNENVLSFDPQFGKQSQFAIKESFSPYFDKTFRLVVRVFSQSRPSSRSEYYRFHIQLHLLLCFHAVEAVYKRHAVIP